MDDDSPEWKAITEREGAEWEERRLTDGELHELYVLRRFFGISWHERCEVIPDWEVAALITMHDRATRAADGE